jgi:hypothetical protein
MVGIRSSEPVGSGMPAKVTREVMD